MDRRLVLIAALAVLPFPAVAQTTAPVFDTPLAAVKAFYDLAIKDEQRPYSQKLRALFTAAIRKSEETNEPVSGLDFDPTIGAQDSDGQFRKTLQFATIPVAIGKATVEVRLRVFKDQPEITLLYDVIREDGAWKVDDISNPDKNDGWRLSTMLIAGAKGE